MTPRSLLAPAKLGGQPILRAQTDERLVELARDGSRVAFEAIVTRYRRQIVSYCSRFLGQERGEDAVQQTFVKAYTALVAGERVRTLRPWLYRIAHNTSLNMLRDRALHHEQLSEEIDGVERPDQAAERRQELAQVLAAVRALPARQRDVIVLRAIEGRTYEQIAEDLGVSHGAVRQLLSRARHGVRTGVAAITPIGLLARIAAPFGDAPTAVLAGNGAGSGTFTAGKICATALAAAVAGGGVTALPDRSEHQPTRTTKASLAAPARAPATPAATATASRAPVPSKGRTVSSGQPQSTSAPRRRARQGSPARSQDGAGRRDDSIQGDRRQSVDPKEPTRRPTRQDGFGDGRPRSPTPAPTQPMTAYRPPDGGSGTRQFASAPRPTDGSFSVTRTETQRLGTRDGSFIDGAR